MEGGGFVSGVMFNYKISPASQAIFLAFLEAVIFFLIKIEITGGC